MDPRDSRDEDASSGSRDAALLDEAWDRTLVGDSAAVVSSATAWEAHES